jgi:hypothetical protein
VGPCRGEAWSEKKKKKKICTPASIAIWWCFTFAQPGPRTVSCLGVESVPIQV